MLPPFLTRLPADRCRPVELGAGATLFRTGDPATALFFLRSGRVRMVRWSPDGHELTVHAVRPGETLAEAAVFADAYHCDTVADLPSVLTAIPCDLLRARMRDDPGLVEEFAAHLARQVRDVRARLEVATLKTAEERLLAAMRLRADRHGVVVLDGTVKALASEIGLTHEAAYRALARLRDKELLEKSGPDRFVLPAPGATRTKPSSDL